MTIDHVSLPRKGGGGEGKRRGWRAGREGAGGGEVVGGRG